MVHNHLPCWGRKRRARAFSRAFAVTFTFTFTVAVAAELDPTELDPTDSIRNNPQDLHAVLHYKTLNYKTHNCADHNNKADHYAGSVSEQWR